MLCITFLSLFVACASVWLRVGLFRLDCILLGQFILYDSAERYCTCNDSTMYVVQFRLACLVVSIVESENVFVGDWASLDTGDSKFIEGMLVKCFRHKLLVLNALLVRLRWTGLFDIEYGFQVKWKGYFCLGVVWEHLRV